MKEETLKEIHKQLLQTYKIKNENYGNSFEKVRKRYKQFPVILIRLLDKMERVESLLTTPGAMPKEESIQDTLMDLANYAIMELACRKEDRQSDIRIVNTHHDAGCKSEGLSGGRPGGVFEPINVDSISWGFETTEKEENNKPDKNISLLEDKIIKEIRLAIDKDIDYLLLRDIAEKLNKTNSNKYPSNKHSARFIGSIVRGLGLETIHTRDGNAVLIPYQEETIHHKGN